MDKKSSEQMPGAVEKEKIAILKADYCSVCSSDCSSGCIVV